MSSFSGDQSDGLTCQSRPEGASIYINSGRIIFLRMLAGVHLETERERKRGREGEASRERERGIEREREASRERETRRERERERKREREASREARRERERDNVRCAWMPSNPQSSSPRTSIFCHQSRSLRGVSPCREVRRHSTGTAQKPFVVT